MFISSHFPNISSILDVPHEKFLYQYRLFLSSLNLSEMSFSYRTRISAYIKLYKFIHELYDSRPEVEKDKWDVRKLGIGFNNTDARYCLDFQKIATPFRELVKTYLYQRVVIQQSLAWSTAFTSFNSLRLFFDYVTVNYPSWDSLNELNRNHIIRYISFLRETPMGFGSNTGRNTGKLASKDHINKYLNALEAFMAYIQRHEFKEAPRALVKRLILPMDRAKQKRTRSEDIKYIPDHIWNQVIDHIHNLPKEIIPIIFLMEATGFRSCDVLLLKKDCLLHQEEGYWVSGAQRKVGIDSHKVPVSAEIADVIKAQIEYVENSIPNGNPNEYLFPILSGRKKGQPYLTTTISHHLNKLAYKFNIVDESSSVFKFRNHAFRHRYGITLINNGMSILHVQKLMAHLSPEMTLIYAQVHDRTARKEWERVKNQGAVRLDVDGHIIEADLVQQAEENKLELEWIRHNLDSIRMDHGFCIKSPKITCSFLNDNIEPPCIKNKCPSLHVDQSFLSYYEDQIHKIKSDIDIFTKSGRTRSSEIIQPKLQIYQKIVSSLLKSENLFEEP
ncbi:tyrosine-type recombinase/integrase [Paenibacillus sp. GCM10012306]|uniref:tyrosine-type recombinase/integrase n=1 Tax=Paenibacillus sp. GCM10012306 TaxID=3317342 RepID=UPI00361A1BBD